jgi:hypothetical protein
MEEEYKVAHCYILAVLSIMDVGTNEPHVDVK